jgi:hypothetical protein
MPQGADKPRRHPSRRGPARSRRRPDASGAEHRRIGRLAVGETKPIAPKARACCRQETREEPGGTPAVPEGPFCGNELVMEIQTKSTIRKGQEAPQRTLAEQSHCGPCACGTTTGPADCATKSASPQPLELAEERHFNKTNSFIFFKRNQREASARSPGATPITPPQPASAARRRRGPPR